MRLETERLILREWEDRDRAPLAAILGDPHVRRFYPAPATPAQVDAQIDHAIARTAEYGFHMQAAELKADGSLVGLIGIGRIPEATRAAIPTHPAVEIGWQFAQRFWGQGLAPEAARAWLAAAWQVFGLPEVVAFTTPVNLPSQRVMAKLPMTRRPDLDFDHPGIADGHPLKRHVVYRAENPGRQRDAPWQIP